MKKERNDRTVNVCKRSAVNDYIGSLPFYRGEWNHSVADLVCVAHVLL